MPHLLEVENLSTVIQSGTRKVRAVDGVSFHIARGETFALLGESGCGKSMTALSLLRLLPTGGRLVCGSVCLNGENLFNLPEVAMRRVRGARMGMIFQEPMTSLNPVLTVSRQISEVLIAHQHLAREKLQQRQHALLEAVGIPDPARVLANYPHQLSGGMKQRIMIAMALACEPDLLIADEPTTALDVTIQAQVLSLLRTLQTKTGMGMLFITHDLGVVSEVAQRVAVMYAGEIVEMATRDGFFQQPHHPYSQKLFDSLPRASKRDETLAVIGGSVPRLDQTFSGCRFAARCDQVLDLCHTQVPRWIGSENGDGVRCHLYDVEVMALNPRQATAKVALAQDPKVMHHESSTGVNALLQVNDLKIHFPIRKGFWQRTVGSVKAVDGVSLSIAPGRTLALVGESGCGKTTVGKGLLQLIPISAGSVQFAGEELTRLTPTALRARRGQFQIIFQDPFSSLDPRMTVMEILEEGIRVLGAQDAMRQSHIDHLLDEVGLSPDSKLRYPHEFSGGQRQRIAIARALAVKPQLIVCDEPTSALDVSVQAQILNLLRSLQAAHQLSYLFITHNISVVAYLAHEVAVMYLGRIVEYGPVAAVLNTPKHPYTQALLSAVPIVEKSGRETIRLQGEMPSPVNPPRGCHFHPRCPQAMPQCAQHYPTQSRCGDGHVVHCHLFPSPAP